MRIAIRMDDITPDMDWKKFLRFKDLLDAHGISPLIGVVPDNRDKKLHIDEVRKDFWEYVKDLQRQGWVIAMHGYNHLYTTREAGLFPIGNKSEFAGLPLGRQQEMIRKGRQILEFRDIYTDIFMAPSHSFDSNTLKALKSNGFRIITDGFGTAPYRERDMVFYPISMQRSRSLKSKSDGIVTFVYHANTMDERDFERLEELLETGKVVSYSEFSKFDIEDRSPLRSALQYLLASAKRTAVNLRQR
jgi:predicted deacetylase